VHLSHSPVAWFSAILIALIAGCTGTPEGREVMLTDSTGAVLLAPPLVEVENQSGTVTVIVDSEERRPRVTADIYPDARMTKSMRESAAAGSAFSAEVADGDGGPVLRVRGGPPQEMEGRAEVDLTVRLASCRGVTVRNSGGAVRLVNVAGPVTVENGVGGGEGGLVIVRTGEPVTEPMTLTTTEGDVFLQVPPASAGRVDLLSLDGEAAFRAQGGRLTDVSPTFSSYRAVLNGGENPIVLRSGRGMVRITVLDHAGTHIPAE
jgi:hypothetical protein